MTKYQSANHGTPHPSAQDVVNVVGQDTEQGKQLEAIIIDWADRVANYALDDLMTSYQIRAGLIQLPDDGNIVLAEVNDIPQIIHQSEIAS